MQHAFTGYRFLCGVSLWALTLYWAKFIAGSFNHENPQQKAAPIWGEIGAAWGHPAAFGEVQLDELEVAAFLTVLAARDKISIDRATASAGLW